MSGLHQLTNHPGQIAQSVEQWGEVPCAVVQFRFCPLISHGKNAVGYFC